MRTNGTMAAVFGGLALLLTACSGGDGSVPEAEATEAAAVEPAQLTVTAGDFFFQTERTVPAGITNIQLVNQGPDFHHVQLVKLASGHTVNELIAWVADHGEQTPEWATLVGGPNSPAPGGTTSGTVDLEPGEYALVCLIPSADGVIHLMKGMVVPLTVTPPTTETAPAPAVDAKMVLDDYSFTVTPELHAGRQTIQVENVAAQPHEVFIVRLADGKVAADLLNWMQTMQGPPPAQPIGGTSLLARGESNYLTLDLQPGEYALYCFVPDAQDKAPHVAHGMVRQFSVR